jgi:NAD+ synthase (glutamine-hydrolysing)
LKSPFEAFRELLNNGGPPLLDLAEENLQARIRGTIVMHISNREGYLALATGNKSELAVGYCTLYGDMAGGLAVIADLPKMIVYELANYINTIHRQELIPANTINKPPSAELRPDQKDEDSLAALPYS